MILRREHLCSAPSHFPPTCRVRLVRGLSPKDIFAQVRMLEVGDPRASEASGIAEILWAAGDHGSHSPVRWPWGWRGLLGRGGRGLS